MAFAPSDRVANDLYRSGALVEAFDLTSAAHLNGLRGSVVAPENDRVIVDFGPPHHRKKLRRENLLFVEGPRLEGSEAVARLVNPLMPIPVGSTLVVPEGEHVAFVHITHWCRVRGKTSARSTLLGKLEIRLDDAAQVVELEDLDMRCPQSTNALWCKRGHVVLRRCHLSAVGPGVAVGGDAAEASVTLIHCSVDGCGQGGIVVQGDRSMAKLVRCKIQNNAGGGIELRHGGSLCAEDCQIAGNGAQGLLAWDKAGLATLSDCTFTDHKKESSILVADKSSIACTRVSVAASGFAGFAVERACAELSECVAEGGLHGLLVQTGKCEVRATACTFRKNRQHGVFIGYDATGKVSLARNTMTKNTVYGIEVCSREKVCEVELDGNHSEDNGRKDNDLVSRMSRLAAKKVPLTDEMLSAAANKVEFPRRNDGTKALRERRTERARKEAGLRHGLPSCASCGKEEPKGERFDLCSNCNSVRYCGRKCQKAHWKEHKPHCKPVAKQPQMCDISQSVYNTGVRPAAGVGVALTSLSRGQVVEATGLRSQVELNGKRGFVVALRAGRECNRVRVDFNEFGSKELLSENVRPCEAEPESMQARPTQPHPQDWQAVEFPPDFKHPWKYFVGQHQGSLPHGDGLLVFEDGGLHIGEFSCEEGTGVGLHYFPATMFCPERVLLGNWKANKPQGAILQLEGSGSFLGRYHLGSAYGLCWVDGQLMSHDQRPPRPLPRAPEGTDLPGLVEALQAEVLEAAVAVRGIAHASSFLACGHSVAAQQLLERAVLRLEQDFSAIV